MIVPIVNEVKVNIIDLPQFNSDKYPTSKDYTKNSNRYPPVGPNR